jgi:hypothetical protein
VVDGLILQTFSCVLAGITLNHAHFSGASEEYRLCSGAETFTLQRFRGVTTFFNLHQVTYNEQDRLAVG